MVDENGTTEPQYPGLNDAVARAVREALAAGALNAPLEAPPPSPGLQMAITPKLGLKQPALDDPALITDINDNMTILDNSITATGVATLTNKTLTAPIINNPTITGWTNAQHSHLDAAGAGQLDGGAIVSGDIGTGFLVRETYVQDYLNSGSDLVDAVVRDTLWWGIAGGSETPVTSVKITGAGKLRLDQHLGVGGNVPAWSVNARVVQVGTGSSLGTDTGAPLRLDLNANSYHDGTSRKAISAGAGGLVRIEGDVLSFDNAPNVAAGVAHVFVPRMAIDTFGSASFFPNAGYPVVVQNTRPQVLLRWSAGRAAARISQVIDAPIIYAMANVMYDGAQWNLDDTAQDGVEAHFYGAPNQPSFAISRMMAGPNPITGPRTKNQLTLSATGTLSIVPDAGSVAINTPGEIQWGAGAGKLSYSGGIPYFHGQTGGYTMLGSGISGGNCISVAPATPNTIHLGWGDRGWALVHSNGGLVQDSSVETKEDIALLDPGSCAEAVLGTDWASFAYKAPGQTPLDEMAPKPLPPEDEEGQARAAIEAKAGEARYAKAMEEAAPFRQQKGYILGSPDYKVHDLFGLPTRAHASPQSDLAVVACALQNVLTRLAALEAAGTPDAPTTTTRTRRKAS